MIVLALTIPDSVAASAARLQEQLSGSPGWEASLAMPPLIPLYRLDTYPSRGQMIRAVCINDPRLVPGELREVPGRLGSPFQVEVSLQGDLNASALAEGLCSRDDTGGAASRNQLNPHPLFNQDTGPALVLGLGSREYPRPIHTLDPVIGPLPQALTSLSLSLVDLCLTDNRDTATLDWRFLLSLRLPKGRKNPVQ